MPTPEGQLTTSKLWSEPAVEEVKEEAKDESQDE
jgi:hypothetical protein